jgi:hypothetical protein
LTSADVELTSSTEFSVTLNAAISRPQSAAAQQGGSTSTGGTLTSRRHTGVEYQRQRGNLADNSNSVLVKRTRANVTSATRRIHRRPGAHRLRVS